MAPGSGLYEPEGHTEHGGLPLLEYCPHGQVGTDGAAVGLATGAAVGVRVGSPTQTQEPSGE